jgi:glutaredoxin 3
MNFIVYSKEKCPYCYKIKQVLELTGTQFVSYNLGDDFTREEFYAKFGKGSTFPQVVCDNEKIGGCVDTIKFLRERQVIKS